MATSPPLSKRRLSKRLREARETAGLTADQVVEKTRELGGTRWSASKITRLERDEWLRPKLDDVEMLLDVYAIEGLQERDTYIQLAKEARQRGWWASYGDVLGQAALTGLEPGASRIRDVSLTVIPGLLQTGGYARSVTLGSGVTDPSEVERRVEARMLRQRILAPEAEGPTYWAIIDEAALRKIPVEAREQQIRHLIEVQRPHLRVQVLPDSAGLHAAIAGGFTLLDFAEETGLAYIENASHQVVIDDEEDVEGFDLAYQYVSASALGVQESNAFLSNFIT